MTTENNNNNSHTCCIGPSDADLQEKKVVSITKAAKLGGVTRQAIYIAIQQKKLKAYKSESGHWYIYLKDLEEYRQKRYSREKSLYNGELIFNNEKGFFSINQIAQKLEVPPQKIYYATRIGLLKASRKGSAWVIHIDDVKDYQEKYLAKRERERKLLSD